METKKIDLDLLNLLEKQDFIDEKMKKLAIELNNQQNKLDILKIRNLNNSSNKEMNNSHTVQSLITKKMHLNEFILKIEKRLKLELQLISNKNNDYLYKTKYQSDLHNKLYLLTNIKNDLDKCILNYIYTNQDFDTTNNFIKKKRDTILKLLKNK